MGIDNTTKRMREDPAEQTALLIEGIATGSTSSFIENQERSGQRQLVNSDRLPSDIHGDRSEWEALGFTFGEPDPDDPLFRPATLPPGWKREGSDHDMWSYIVDPLGRRRAGVFYKAAFYDRKAHINLVSLGWYVTSAVEYDAGPIIFDDEWATREAVLAEMRESAAGYRQRAGEFREYATDGGRRDADNRAGCAEIASDYEARAAIYDAAAAKLESADA